MRPRFPCSVTSLEQRVASTRKPESVLNWPDPPMRSSHPLLLGVACEFSHSRNAKRMARSGPRSIWGGVVDHAATTLGLASGIDTPSGEVDTLGLVLVGKSLAMPSLDHLEGSALERCS